MPLPQFSKSGNAFSPFQFERARSLPVEAPIRPQQIVGVAGGGQVKVAELAEQVELVEVNVDRISTSNKGSMLEFLKDTTVRWKKFSFTFTDENGISFIVRLWNIEEVNVPQVRGGKWSARILLRKEIT